MYVCTSGSLFIITPLRHLLLRLQPCRRCPLPTLQKLSLPQGCQVPHTGQVAFDVRCTIGAVCVLAYTQLEAVSNVPNKSSCWIGGTSHSQGRNYDPSEQHHQSITHARDADTEKPIISPFLFLSFHCLEPDDS